MFQRLSHGTTALEVVKVAQSERTEKPRGASWYRLQAWWSVLFMLGICLAAVSLATSLRLRVDLTADRSFTLSPATKDLLAQLEDRLELVLYFNRDIEGAEQLLPLRIQLQDLLDEITAAGRGKVSVETVDPTTDLAVAQDAEHAGITPLPMQMAGVGSVSFKDIYQGLEMRYLDRKEVISFLVPQGFEPAFAYRLANLLQDQRPVVGFFSREPAAPPLVPGMTLPTPPDRIFENLRNVVGRRYAIRDIQLNQGRPVDDDLVALVVARPKNLTELEIFEIDQYLTRGGHVLVLYDHGEIVRETGDYRRFETGMDDWLKGMGINIPRRMIWDEQGLPQQVDQRTVVSPDGVKTTVPLSMNFGLWLHLKGDSLARDHIATGFSEELVIPFAYPIGIGETPQGIEVATLLQSSKRSWVLPEEINVAKTPGNIERLKGTALAQGPARPHRIAVALSGRFPSRYDALPEILTQRELVSESAPGLLVVIGDSDMFHNSPIEHHPQSFFASNLFDWLVQDESLIQLRMRGRQDRGIRNFAREYIEENDLLAASQEEQQELDRQARSHRLAKERMLGWSNVLVPPLLILSAGLMHWRFWRRRARTVYEPKWVEES